MQDRDQSEFNMSVSYLNRLNTLFYAANECSIQMDLYNWFHILQALYRELSTEMKPEEQDKYFNPQTGIIMQINRKMLNNTSNRSSNKIPTDLYYMLFDFELFLRNITKKSGLLIKKMDDPKQALQ